MLHAALAVVRYKLAGGVHAPYVFVHIMAHFGAGVHETIEGTLGARVVGSWGLVPETRHSRSWRQFRSFRKRTMDELNGRVDTLEEKSLSTAGGRPPLLGLGRFDYFVTACFWDESKSDAVETCVFEVARVGRG